MPDYSDIQTHIGVRIKMIVTPHQDMSSWWQMDAFLGHHNDRKWLHFQWEKLNMWNLLVQVDRQPGSNLSAGDRFSHPWTHTTMHRQSSCDIPYGKSSSWMLNETYRHLTSLHSGTVQKYVRSLNLITYLEKKIQLTCSPSPSQLSKWKISGTWLDSARSSVEWECWNGS